jgi:autotransporter-associated beta strand protein
VDELTLSGVNTFSGPTNVDAGILTLSGGSALINSMAVTVSSGGTLKLASSEEIASLAGAGAVNLQGNVLNVSGGVDTTYSGLMSGAGSLVKTGSAVFTMTVSNTFSGGVTLNEGAIQAGDDAALGSGTVTFSGGRISSNSATARSLVNAFAMSGTLGLGDATNTGMLTLSGDVALGADTTLTVASAATLSGVLSGGYSLTKAGAAGLTLSGVNTFGGPTNVDAGMLTLSGGSALINSMAVAVSAGGTLKLASSEEIASLAGEGAVWLEGNTLTLGGTGSTTYGGVISGSGMLVKNGWSVLALNGENAFEGGVDLSAGVLSLGNNSALGTGLVTFSGGTLAGVQGALRAIGNEFVMSGILGLGEAVDGGTLTLSGGVALASETTLRVLSQGTINGVISGAHSFTKEGGAELTLGGANVFSGSLIVGEGVLKLNGGAAVADATAVRVNDGATLRLGESEAVADLSGGGGVDLQSYRLTLSGGDVGRVFAGSLSGAGSLWMTGSGEQTLSGASSFSGGLYVLAGTLRLGVDNALLSSGSVIVSGGELALGTSVQTIGVLQLTGGLISVGGLIGSSYQVEAGRIDAVLGGSHIGLTKSGTGTVVLGGFNTYTGETLVRAGVLQLGAADRLDDGSALTLEGGTFDLAGFTESVSFFTLGGGRVTGGTLNAAGYILNSGTVATSFTGVSTVSKRTDGLVELMSANDYTGGTEIRAGTLRLGGDDRLPVTGRVNLIGGSLDLNGYSQSAGVVTLTAGTIANGVLAGGSYQFLSGEVSAVLAGGGELVKTGSLSVSLGGLNTYTGGTRILEGTLRLALGGGLADAGSLEISGGVFDLGSLSETVGAVRLMAGVIQNGTLLGSGYATFGGTVDAVLAGGAGLIKSGTGTVTLMLANSYSGGTTVNDGTLRLGASERLLDAGSLSVVSGQFDLGTYTETVGVVRLLGGEINNGELFGSAYLVEAGAIGARLSGAASLLKTGTGLVTLNAVSHYTGGTTVEAGTLEIGGSELLAGSSALSVAGGRLSLGASAYTQTVGSLDLTGGMLSGGTIVSGSLRLWSGVVDSVLAGTGGFSKQGDGTVHLNAASTVTGTVDIRAGVLRLGGSEKIADAASLWMNGGTLDLSQSVETVGLVRLSAGSILAGELTGSSYTVESGVILAALLGSGSLTKSTLGTVTLGGSNRLSGALEIQAGSLVIVGNGMLSSGSVSVSGESATLDLGMTRQSVGGFTLGGGTVQNGELVADGYGVSAGLVSAVLGGSGALTKTGVGIVVLAGTNTYSGGTRIEAGTLELSVDNALLSSGSITLGNGVLSLGATTQTTGLFELNGGELLGGMLQSSAFEVRSGTIAGVLAGSGALLKLGSGTVRMTVGSTFMGGTTVRDGLLELDGAGLLGSSTALTIEGGEVKLTSDAFAQTLGDLRLSGGSLSGGIVESGLIRLESGVVNSVLAGSGGMIKSTSGVVALNGSNTFGGVTLVQDGVLRLGAGERLSDSSSLSVTGGVFDLSGFVETVSEVALGGGSLSGGTLVAGSFVLNVSGQALVDSVLAGSAALIKHGTGLAVIQKQSVYTNGTVVNEGTLRLDVNDALLGVGAVNLNGGELVLGTTSQQIGLLTLNGGSLGGGTVVASNYVLRDGTVNSVLAGTGSLVKQGAGVARILSVNTYAGGTTLENGVLALELDNALFASGSVAISGGELRLGTTTQTLGSLTLSSGLISGGTILGSRYEIHEGTVDAVLAGNDAVLEKVGPGVAVLNQRNTYLGSTVLNGGELRLGLSDALAVAGSVQVNSGVLDLGGNAQTLAGFVLSGGSVINGSLILSAGSFDLNVGIEGSLGAALSGTAGLLKRGSGLVTVFNQNLYTGGTEVRGGVLRLSVENALAASGSLVLSGGELSLGATNQQVGSVVLSSGMISGGTLDGSVYLLLSGTVGSQLIGAGELTKDAGGLVTLSGANVLSGGMRVLDGTLALAGFGRLSAGTLTLDGSGAFVDLGATLQDVSLLRLTSGSVGNGTLNASGGYELHEGVVAAMLTGSGSLVKNGAGLVILTGANDYSGVTDVNLGVLRLGASDVLSAMAGGVNVYGGSLDLGGYATDAGQFTLAGGAVTNGTLNALGYELRSGLVNALLIGGGSLNKVSSGEVFLNGEISLAGTLFIRGGSLTLQGSERIGDDTVVSLEPSGVLNLGGATETVGRLRFNGGEAVSGTIVASVYELFSGTVGIALGGSGAVEKVSDGVVVFGGNGSTSSTYSGGTIVKEGTLRLGMSNALNGAGIISIEGGLFDLDGFTQDVSGLRLSDGSISGGSVVSSGVFELQNGVVGATLGGAGALLKTGSGTVRLDAANLYLGGSTVLEGMLELAQSGALGVDGAVFARGGTLRLGGVGHVVHSLLLGGSESSASVEQGTFSAAELDLVSGVVDARLEGSARLVKSGAGLVVLQQINGYTGGTLIHEGTLQLHVNGALTAGGDVAMYSGNLLLGTTTQQVGVLSLFGGTISGGTVEAQSYEVRSGVVSSVLSGSAGLIKSGSGTVSLLGANIYSGSTSVIGGRLVLGGSQVLSRTGALLVEGGELDLGGAFWNNVDLFTLWSGSVVGGVGTGAQISADRFVVRSGSIWATLAGSGGLTKESDGTVYLLGANTYLGATSVLGGRLVLGGNNVLAAATTLTVSGGTLDLGGAFSNAVQSLVLQSGLIENGVITAGSFVASSGTIASRLLGEGALRKISDGDLTLSGVNGYTGGTFVDAGRLLLAGSQVLLDSGSVEVRGGTLNLGGHYEHSFGSLRLESGRIEGGTVTAGLIELFSGVVDAVLAGTGSITKAQEGTVVLQTASTHTGGTRITGGTLRLGGDERLLDSGSLLVAGGAFELDGFVESVAAVTLLGGEIRNGSLNAASFDLRAGTIGASLGGSGSLVKSGIDTVTLSGVNRQLGGTFVEEGSLVLSVSGALSEAGSLSVSGGEVSLWGTVQQATAVSLFGGKISGGSLRAGSFELRGGEVSASLLGDASLVKTGTGLVVLSGANTYTGETFVEQGTLRLEGVGVQTVSSGSITIGGGRLEIGAGGGVGGQINDSAAVRLDSGVFTFAPGVVGASETIGTLRVVGGELITGANTLIGSGSTIRIEGGSTTVSAGGRLGDHHWVLSGGTNVIALGGTMEVRGLQGSGATGLELIGNGSSLLTIEAGGKLALGNDIIVEANAGSAVISSTGTGLSAGQLDLTGGTRTVTVHAGSAASGLVLSVSVANGGLVKAGAGSLVLNGVNNFSSSVWLREGVLELGAIGALKGAAGTGLLFEGGTLRFGTGAIDDISGSIGAIAAGQFAKIDTNGQSVSFGEGLSGAGGLLKLGEGSLVLAGASVLGSGAIVEGGTLELAMSDVLTGDSQILVRGGLLELGGTIQRTGLVTLETGEIRGGTIEVSRLELGSGVISSSLNGTGTIRKSGDGTVLLSGSGAFGGVTEIVGGTLELGVSGVVGGTVNISGARLELGATSQSFEKVVLSSGSLTGGTVSGSVEAWSGLVGSVISGSGSFVKEGVGRVELFSELTNSGGVLVKDGTLELGATAGITGTVTVSGGQLALGNTTQAVQGLVLDGGAIGGGTIHGALFDLRSGVMNAVLAGTGALVKSGTGEVTIAGPNTYTGGTTLWDGVLSLSGGGVLGSGGSLTVFGGALNLGLTTQAVGDVLLLQGSIGGGSLEVANMVVEAGTISASVTGTGSLIKQGAGEVLISGVVSQAGGTEILGGSLTLGGANLLSGAGSLFVSGGQLNLGGFTNSVGMVHLVDGSILNGTLSGAGFLLESGTVSAVLEGSGGMIKRTEGRLLLSAVAQYTGETVIEGGVLELGVENALSSGDVRINGGELVMGSTVQYVAKLRLSGGSISGGSMTVGLLALEAGSLYSSMNGSGSLLKTGTGTVYLMVANGFTGGTVVEQGTLRFGLDHALFAGGRVEVSGGELALGVTTQRMGAVHLSGGLISGGTVVGDSYVTTAGTVSSLLAGTAALVKEGPGTLQFKGAASYTGGTTVRGGVLELEGSQLLARGGALTIVGGEVRLSRDEHRQDFSALNLSGGSLRGGTFSAGSIVLESGFVESVVAGSHGMTKTTAGVVTLSGSSTLTGIINLQNGVLRLGAAERIADAGSLWISGGTLDLNGHSEAIGLVRLSGGSISGGGLLGGSFGIQIGSLNAGQAPLVPTLAPGTLELAVNNAFSGDQALSVVGGKLNLSGTVQKIGELSMNGGVLSGGTIEAQAYELNAGSVSTVLSGTSGLVKRGSGTLRIDVSTRHTGGTVVHDGSLILGVADALVRDKRAEVAGGALVLEGVPLSVGSLTLSGGSILGGTLVSALVDPGSLAPAVFNFVNGRVTSALSGSGKLLISGGTVVYAPRVESPGFGGRIEIAENATLQLGDETLLSGTFTALLGGSAQSVVGRPGVIQNDGVLAFKFGAGVKIELPNVMMGKGATEYLSVDGAVGYSVKFTGKNLGAGGVIFRSGVEFDLSDDKAFGVTLDKNGREVANSAPVNLNGGSLRVNSNVVIPSTRTLNLGSLGGVMNLAGRLSVAGTIAGAGSLSVNGTGALLIQNAGNSYTGGTKLNGGLLRLEDGNVGSGSLFLAGAAKLEASITKAVVELPGAISGSGAISKSGSGVLRITSSNDGYTGAISVQAGTIQLSSRNGSVGGLGNASSVVNNAAIQVAGSGNFVIQKPITGTGVLVIGDGTAPAGEQPEVTLSAKNEFTGDTQINGGVLNLSGSASLSSQKVEVASAGSVLRLQSGASLDVAQLKLQSGGVLDVTAFGGSAGTVFTIGVGKSIGGSGGVVKGSIALGAGSSLAPGNSPGVLNVVSGTYEAQFGSLYTADFDQSTGAFDQIRGQALITGGTLMANALTRVVRSGSYAVVSPGGSDAGVRGVYSNVDADFFTQWASEEIKQLYIAGGSGMTAVLKARAVYTPNSVVMAVERKPYASFGIGVNAAEFGDYLDRAAESAGGLLEPLLRLDVMHSDAEVAQAIRGAGVSQYANLLTVSRRRMLDLSLGVGARLDLLGLAGARDGGVDTNVGTGKEGWSLWTSTVVSLLNRDAQQSQGFGGYNVNGQSSVMGVERPFGALRIGFIGSTGTTTSNFSAPYARISSDSWHLGGYASLPVAPFYADVAFIYGHVDNDATRNIEFPGSSASARAQFRSQEYVFRIGGGYQIMPSGSMWELTPTEHLQYVGAMQAGFDERAGGPLGARLQKGKQAALINEVGMTVGRRWVVARVPVAVRLQGSWLHDFAGDDSVRASLLSASSDAGSFRVLSAGGDKNAFRLNGSLEIAFTQRISLRLTAEREIRRSSSRSYFNVTIGLEF